MTPHIVKDAPGRPTVGSEAKSVTVKFRIEPTLKDELTYVCRSYGIPVSEGLRRGVIMFINNHHKRYY